MPNRIDLELRALKAAGTTALAPFLTIGYPDVNTSFEVAKAAVESGGDMLELGIPFSDPLAEGPAIQRTSFRALEQGVNVRTCLEFIHRLRREGIGAPLIPMGYYNPFLRYGIEAFAREAAAAGADGIIVPDLPMEESGPLRELLNEQGLYVIPLLAPTSPDERIERACADADGFIYCVSLTGVTGAREDLASGVERLVERIRRHSDLPLLVGFGVSSADHVEAIGRFADGAIVGSALMNAIDEAPRNSVIEVVRDFVAGLKRADRDSSQHEVRERY